MHDHFDPLGKFMTFVLAVFGVRPHEELRAGHRVPPKKTCDDFDLVELRVACEQPVANRSPDLT